MSTISVLCVCSVGQEPALLPLPLSLSLSLTHTHPASNPISLRASHQYCVCSEGQSWVCILCVLSSPCEYCHQSTSITSVYEHHIRLAQACVVVALNRLAQESFEQARTRACACTSCFALAPTCKHPLTHTQTHPLTHTQTHPLTHTRTHTYTHTHTHVHTYTRTYIHTCTQSTVLI